MQKIITCVVFCLMALVVTSTNGKLFEVTEANWERLLSTDEWMVEFYAPWCPACNRFESVWKEFSEKSDYIGIKVGAADVNANPVLSGLFSVTSLPTVYHIKNGQYRVFTASRDLQTLTEFITKKQWEKVEPSSSWLTPNSFLIKMLSLLFKATLYFKDLYTHLNESYGLPTWVVLGLFVVITIALGLLMGIGLIICIDFIFPPKKCAPEELLEHEADDDEESESPEQSNDKEIDNSEPTATVKRRSKAKKDH